MKRTMVLASRNAKETVRDPLSYIFIVGLPLLMLVLMTLINESIPPQAGMTIYTAQELTPAIVCFAYTFLMLQASLLTSKDRSTAILTRLFSSPAKAGEYLTGYMLPFLAIGAVQAVVTYVCGGVISIVVGGSITLTGCVFSFIMSLPALFFFVGLGMLFGSVLNEKGAPPLTSMIVTLSSILGGVFMDIETVKGLNTVAEILPFYHSIRLARDGMAGVFDRGDLVSLAVMLAWTVAVYIVASLFFRRQMRRK